MYTFVQNALPPDTIPVENSKTFIRIFICIKYMQSPNLKNLSRVSNPPKTGLNLEPA